VKQIIDELIGGNPSLWASSEHNHLVINLISFRGLMPSEDRDLDIIVSIVKGALK